MSSTVLYVDDEPQLPDRVDELLGQAGYTLVHTSDPEEALRFACEEVPAIVLIDVLIERCDGFELLEDLGFAGGAGPIPTVVYTRGERTPKLYGHALELGVEDFLCKPVMAAEILEAVLEFARKDEEPEPEVSAARVTAATVRAPATGAPTTPARPAAPAPRPAITSFEGELTKQPLSGLFGRLHRVGASGALRLKKGREERAVQFRNGSPVEVERHRDLPPIEDHLRRTGRIDEVQYEMLVDQLMARIAGPLEILLGMGALTEPELTKAMREQAISVLEEMFDWTEGHFSFEPDGQVEPTRSIEFGIDPMKILLAGLNQTPDAVIKDALEQRSHLFASYSPTQSKRLEELGLTSGQRRHVEAMLGTTSVADILAAKKIGARMLYSLYAMGAVDLVQGPVLMLEEILLEETAEVPKSPPVVSAKTTPAPPVAPPRPAAPPAARKPAAPVAPPAPPETAPVEPPIDVQEEVAPTPTPSPATTKGKPAQPGKKSAVEKTKKRKKSPAKPAPPPAPEVVVEPVAPPEIEIDVDLEPIAPPEAPNAAEPVAPPASPPVAEPEGPTEPLLDIDVEFDIDPIAPPEPPPIELPDPPPDLSIPDVQAPATAPPAVESPSAPEISRRRLPESRPSETSPAAPIAAASIEATIDEMAERLGAENDFELFGIDQSSADSAVRAAYDRLLANIEFEGLTGDDPDLAKRARNVRSRIDQAYQRVRTPELRRLFSGLKKKKKAEKSSSGEIAVFEADTRETGSRAVEAESWFRTGEGHMEHEEFAKASEAFGMAVHLDPRQGDYAAYLGYALYRSNPHNEVIRREALEHVAKGVKLAPNREKPLLFLSRIFRETGEVTSAAKVLRRALKANPDSPALVQEMCMIDPASSQSKRKKLLDHFRRK